MPNQFNKMFTVKIALGQAISVGCEIHNLLVQKPDNSPSNSKFVFRLYFYQRIRVIGKSILKLLPDNNSENIDLVSIFSLTRAFILAHKSFDYLFIEKLENSEYELRKLVFQAYDLIERIEMMKYLVDEQEEKLSQKKEELEKIKQDIKDNSFFQNIPNLAKAKDDSKDYYSTFHQSINNNNPNQQGYGGFCKGLIEKLNKNEGCLKPDSKILIEKLKKLNTPLIQVDFSNDNDRTKLKNRFDYFYKYLSNYVHVSAFSSGQQIDSSFSTNEKIELFLKTAISACVFYLYTANNDILRLFPSIANENFIEDHKSSFEGVKSFIEILTGTQSFL